MAAAQHSRSVKTERLINMVMCLRWARRPLTRPELFTLLADYASVESDAARHRMFERDKDELRSAGYAIDVVPLHSAFDDEHGYVLREPPAAEPVTLTPEERVVLAIAATMWQHTRSHRAAMRALHKLGVPTGSHTDQATSWELVAPQVAAALDACVSAVRSETVVCFPYGTAEGAVSVRTVSPWELHHRRGWWYLFGLDHDRGDSRVFRLDRMHRIPATTRRPTFHPQPSGVTWSGSEQLEPAIAVSAVVSPRVHREFLHQHKIEVRAEDTAPSSEVKVEWRSPSLAAAAALLLPYAGECHSITPASVADACVNGWSAVRDAHDPATRARLSTKALRSAESAAGRAAGSDFLETGSSTPTGEENALERSLRLMSMVPWLLTHQGVRVADAAAHFGVSEEKIVSDLQVLFLCGTPGGYHDDLIDASWESGRIYVSNADALGAEVELTDDERWPLCVGLTVLRDHAATPEQSAVAERVLSALTQGATTAPSPAITIAPEDALSARHVPTVRDALATHSLICLEYLSHHSQSLSTRVVQPVQLMQRYGHWYLTASDAGVHKHFRLDRCVKVQLAGSAPESEPAPPSDPPVPLQVAVVEADESSYATVEYYGGVVLSDSARHRRYAVQGQRWEWLRAVALGAGGGIRVLHPLSVADDVYHHASQALTTSVSHTSLQ